VKNQSFCSPLRRKCICGDVVDAVRKSSWLDSLSAAVESAMAHLKPQFVFAQSAQIGLDGLGMSHLSFGSYICASR
jgi:hypothetical protein